MQNLMKVESFELFKDESLDVIGQETYLNL